MIEDTVEFAKADDVLEEIQDANHRFREWRERGGTVESLYRGEGDGENSDSAKFKILWSITEMQRPLIYDQAPDPVARRRFLEKDEPARIAAQVIERSLMYSMDLEGHDFHEAMCDAREDFLLPGRGQCRVVYEAGFKTTPQKIYLDEDELVQLDEDTEVERDQTGNYRWSGEDDPKTLQEKAYEEAYIEHVHWRDFVHSDGKKWGDVWWVAFGSWLSRDDLIEQFGKKVGERVPTLKKYNTYYKEDAYKPYKAEYSAYQDYARVWEVWDRRTRMVYKVAEFFDEFLEKPIEDPYGLEKFYPCPKPVYMVKTTGSLEPVPEYKMYEDQANELNTITGRIDRLTDSLAVRGIGDARLKTSLSRLYASRETEIVLDSEFAQVAATGGIEGAIMWAPMDKTSQVIMGLLNQRQQNIQLIWDIVGMSDILRGSTHPRESGKAQQLKYQMVGGMRSRIGNKQKRMQWFARDAIRLLAEVISELFSKETLLLMSGVDKGVFQQVAVEEVMKLLRADKKRGFRIDIETDSTIAKDELREKEELMEFFGAISQLLGAAQGAAASKVMSPTALRQIILWAAKRFPAGRDLEQMLETAMQGEDEKKASPEEEAKQMEAKIKVMKLQLDREEMMADNMMRGEELKRKWAELELKYDIDIKKIRQQKVEALINKQTAEVNAAGGNAKK